MNKVLQHADVVRANEVCQKTLSPQRYLRTSTTTHIYSAIPTLAKQTIGRPSNGETPLDFFNRLRRSETPEDAVTLAAYVPKPQPAIWWAHETLRLLPALLCDNDARLLEHIGRWVQSPNTQSRHWIMRRALFANRQTPTVHLGLAVGWSGGSVAPNDRTGAPRHRCPSAINTAVHATMAKTRTADRPLLRNHILDLAEPLFRAY